MPRSRTTSSSAHERHHSTLASSTAASHGPMNSGSHQRVRRDVTHRARTCRPSRACGRCGGELASPSGRSKRRGKGHRPLHRAVRNLGRFAQIQTAHAQAWPWNVRGCGRIQIPSRSRGAWGGRPEQLTMGAGAGARTPASRARVACTASPENLSHPCASQWEQRRGCRSTIRFDGLRFRPSLGPAHSIGGPLTSPGPAGLALGLRGRGWPRPRVPLGAGGSAPCLGHQVGHLTRTKLGRDLLAGVVCPPALAQRGPQFASVGRAESTGLPRDP